MKLKNKLLPLLTLTAASGMVSPLILTSCAKEETWYEYDYTDPDTKPLFNPLTPGEEGTVLTQKQITDIYVDKIANEPGFFANDFGYSTASKFRFLINNTGNESNIKSLTIKCNVPKLGKTIVNYPGEKKYEYRTISFSWKMILDYSITNYYLDEQDKFEHHVEFDCTYDNVIFFVGYNDLYDYDEGLGEYAASSYFNVGPWSFYGYDALAAYRYNSSNFTMDLNVSDTVTTTIKYESGEKQVTTTDNAMHYLINDITSLTNVANQIADSLDDYGYFNSYVILSFTGLSQHALFWNSHSYVLSKYVSAPELSVEEMFSSYEGTNLIPESEPFVATADIYGFELQPTDLDFIEVQRIDLIDAPTASVTINSGSGAHSHQFTFTSSWTPTEAGDSDVHFTGSFNNAFSWDEFNWFNSDIFDHVTFEPTWFGTYYYLVLQLSKRDFQVKYTYNVYMSDGSVKNETTTLDVHAYTPYLYINVDDYLFD